MVALNCSQCICGRRWSMEVKHKQRLPPPAWHSTSSAANTQPSPSLCSSTPTDTLRLPPSCHTAHKNEVRSKAHIRRAGGSTLSGVRNNSFWPSPACVLKWFPLSSSVSAGSSYWVGGGHYTTWLQNLHRPLRKAKLIERPCQIVFWLRRGAVTIPGVLWCLSPRAHIPKGTALCKGGGGAYNLFRNVCLSAVLVSAIWKAEIKQYTLIVRAKVVDLKWQKVEQVPLHPQEEKWKCSYQNFIVFTNKLRFFKKKSFPSFYSRKCNRRMNDREKENMDRSINCFKDKWMGGWMDERKNNKRMKWRLDDGKKKCCIIIYRRDLAGAKCFNLHIC